MLNHREDRREVTGRSGGMAGSIRKEWSQCKHKSEVVVHTREVIEWK